MKTASESNFEKVRRSEYWYRTQLRKVARTVGDFVRGFPANDPSVLPPLIEMLERYSVLIEPWARASAEMPSRRRSAPASRRRSSRLRSWRVTGRTDAVPG